jgi:3-methylfumaryl-CoA hydratase
MDWIGRSETVRDTVTAATAEALAATLNHEPREWVGGDTLPLLWHWTICTGAKRQSDLGPDGHAAKGGFLPPIDKPRRMWVRGTVKQTAPLRVGEAVKKVSTVKTIEPKEGASGAFVLVTVEHVFTVSGDVRLTETQTLAYRDAPAEPTPEIEPLADGIPQPDWAGASRIITPDPVLLFRYSALTFNGHRIHYDRTHATQTEGYPGLVVHGPLIATLLAETARAAEPDAMFTHFKFRAVAPIFDTREFRASMVVEADETGYRLEATCADGVTAMVGAIG